MKVVETLELIRWLILDVDGTMTDGGIYLDGNGVEIKKFTVQDGAAVLLAKAAGIEPVILTGRESGCVSKRAGELGIRCVFQNVKNKKEFLSRFLEEHQIPPEEAAYVGDDLNDLGAMRCVGTAVCPQNAAKQVKSCCSYVLSSRGGEGAVREFVEMILEKRGILDECAGKLWG